MLTDYVIVCVLTKKIYADIKEHGEPRPLPPAKMFTEATGKVLRERYA